MYKDMYSADKERKANETSPTGALSTSYGFEKDKTSVQVTKRDGQGIQYKFRHFDDVSRYMIEYRKKHTVGQVCQMHDRLSKSGFSLPNINAKRYKKIRWVLNVSQYCHGHLNLPFR